MKALTRCIYTHAIICKNQGSFIQPAYQDIRQGNSDNTNTIKRLEMVLSPPSFSVLAAYFQIKISKFAWFIKWKSTIFHIPFQTLFTYEYSYNQDSWYVEIKKFWYADFYNTFQKYNAIALIGCKINSPSYPPYFHRSSIFIQETECQTHMKNEYLGLSASFMPFLTPSPNVNKSCFTFKVLSYS